MLRHYLLTALRRLNRRRGYALLNTAGLSVGLGCALLIALFVRDELSYDRYHAHADRIYRLAAHVDGASYGDGIAKVTDPWGPAAVDQLPEVEAQTRFVIYGRTLVERDGRRAYETEGLYADPTVFEIFSWPLLAGDPATALAEPNTVVLTRAMADRYFPDEDPVGQTLTFDTEAAYLVTGVVDDVPRQSHFGFSFLVSLDTYTHPDRGDWTRWNQFYTYLLLRPDAAPEAVAAAFDAVLDRHLEPEAAAATSPLLQPITRIHLHSKLWREMSTNSDVLYVYLFSAVAAFLLAIACLNFVNLATARAARRAREVGVRKAAGATRGMLVRQYLGEALLLSATAVILAAGLVELALPAFNVVSGKSLAFEPLADPALALGLAGLTLIVGMASGLYPAFVLASFRPIDALRGRAGSAGGARLRRGLVVVQFALSAFLIAATAVVQAQLDFIRDKNLGFSGEQVLTVFFQESDTWRQGDAIKQTLFAHPGVERVSISANQPGGSDYGIPYEAEGMDEVPPARMLIGDADFVDTYGIEVVRGRGFSADRATDSTAYLINETLARQLGWDDPIGKTLAMPAVDRPPGPIIGVVRDFHFHSLHEPVGPLLLFMAPSWASRMSVKLRPDQIAEAVAFIEETWTRFEPDHPLVSSFVDDRFDLLYRAETRMAQVVGAFTALALLIACLGLFGLTAYTTQQRTREIGVRKVLGASTGRIVALLSKDVLVLVGLALVVALPPAYLAAESWLGRFAYGVSPGARLFLLVGVVTVALALLTVSTQALRAARANPVDALRME